MLKKVLAVFLSVLILFSCLLSACGDNHGGLPDGVYDPGSGEEEPLPGGGDGDDDDRENENIVLENADILAISYDRLENADLSFNFDIDVSADKQVAEYSAPGAALTYGACFNGVSALKEETEKEIYEITAEEYRGDTEPSGDDNFFKNQEDTLERMSAVARKTADYVIDNITVANTVVVNGNYRYLLNYDADSDVVTVYERIDYLDTNYSEYNRIIIYYNADGDETVSMTRVYGAVTEDVIYTPGKYYSVRVSDSENGMYNVSVAYKDNGFWRGIDYNFELDNPYITHEGIYDYANGLLYVRFLFENDSGIYTFGDQCIALRDGVETGSGVEARPEDVIVLSPYMLSGNGVYADFLHSFIRTDLYVLDGWDKLRIVLDTESELSYVGEQYVRGEGDFFRLESGLQIGCGDLWNKETGMLFQKWEYGGTDGNHYWSPVGFIDENGNAVENIPYENTVTVENISAYIDRTDDKDEGTQLQKISSAYMLLRFENIDQKAFALCAEFFREHGLSVTAAPDIFAGMADLCDNRALYTDEVFEYLYNRPYNAENFIANLFTIADELDALRETVTAALDDKETVDFENLPEKPENIGLVDLGGILAGKAKIGESGIDFSDMTASQNKSVILSEGKEYGIFVAWTGDKGYADAAAFDRKTYDFGTMEFRGKSGINLPQIDREGTYRLQAYFGKYEDGNRLRLSEVIILPVEYFENFSVNVPTEGGYYRHDFFVKDGAAAVTVSFTDTLPPEILFDGEPIVGNTFKTEIGESIAAAEFARRFTAFDAVDGNIAVSAENFSAEGVPLSETDAIIDGIYKLTVKDAAGNSAETYIEVTVVSK